MKFKILLIIIIILTIILPSTSAQILDLEYDYIDEDSTRIYFVTGIGMYIEGGTWPAYEEISPIFLIRFGKTSGCQILYHNCGERIDFIEGDKFIGHYPYLNPIGIGFVCGIWIDVER